MKKSMTGFPLTIFQMWLYAPLLILAYVDYATISSFDKAGLIGLLVAIVGTSFIAWSVIFSKEFRQFTRSTPLRILVFFGIVFGVTAVFLIVFNALLGDFQFTTSLLKIPGFVSLVLTPAMVMRLEVLMPMSEDK